MIIVTGGAGFIGSRLIKKLNKQGYNDIIMVDDLTDGSKVKNIADLTLQDYVDKSKFMELFPILLDTGKVRGVYHLGAESSTKCTDGKYLMENNYQYTCNIITLCANAGVPLVYASSAAVYGNEDRSGFFSDISDQYEPTNMYGFSKLQADKYARKIMSESATPIMGARYFNVYSDGKFEQHKADEGMRSPIAWMKEQLDWEGEIKLFEGSENFKRDFIHIDEVVDMTINLMKKKISGVYNIGTGKARSFVELAKEELGITDEQIRYIPMPYELQGHYQKFTEADMKYYPR